MEKPKIIVWSTAYHPFVGGAEVAIQEVAERLKDRFDFYIVTARLRRDLPKREVRPEGIVIRRGLGMSFDKWFLPLSVFWNSEFGIWDFTRRSSRVLWGMDISQGSSAAALIKFFRPRVPFVFTIQYGESGERLQKGRGGAIGFAFRFILAQADYVTSISTYLSYLAKEYGYPGQEAVVPNGVDTQQFRNQKSEALNDSNKIIITTSRLVPKNGIDILVEALAIVQKNIPDIQCHIVGDGPEAEGLRFKVASLKLQDNVKFFGAVPHAEVPRYLHGADVFVRPSRSEGMGNSFVEALAAGLPVICTSVGGIPDIIEDGKTGLFANVDDPEDLAIKIQMLLQDRVLSQGIVREGQELVRRRFEWSVIARSYGEIFSFCAGARFRLLIATGLFPPEVGGPATYSKILLEELPRLRVLVSILPFRTVRRLPKVLRHAAYFWRCAQKGRAADIIFAQDPVSVGIPAACAAIFLRKKFVMKVVGDYAWEQAVQRFGVTDLLDDFLHKRYGWRVELLRKVEQWSARRAERIIAPSQYLKKVLVHWGVAGEKVSVIYNALHLAGPLDTRDTARKKLGLRGTVLVSIGRLVPWKGFEMLIEMMVDIRKKFPDCQLAIIGEGPQKKILESHAAALQLETAVTLVGGLPPEEVQKYIRAADVFLLNTAYEGFSHTILEAMGLGSVVVTTSVGGNSELVEDRQNVLAVPFNDKKKWVAAILEILGNPALRNDLAKTAEKRAREFTQEKMIQQLLDVLK